MADEKYRLQLEGSQVDDALLQMNQRVPEGWAVGTRDGSPVGPGSQFHQNNAKYYAEQAGGSLDAANAAAARAEAAVPAGTAGAVFFDRDQSLTEAQKEQTRKNIGAANSNKNILRNWFFSTPVNSRGKTTYGPNEYAVDGWKIWGDAYFTIGDYVCAMAQGGQGGGLFQYIENSALGLINGKTVTYSVIINDTLYSATGTFSQGAWIAANTDIPGVSIVLVFPAEWPNDVISASIRLEPTLASTIYIRAAKLEVGTVSTLLNDAPANYGEELTKCIYSKAYPADTCANNGFGRTNPNLLDNWYFAGTGSIADGTFPINQRGLSSYSGTRIGFDRWHTFDYSGAMSAALTWEGVQLHFGANGADEFAQIIPTNRLQDGKTYTFSVQYQSGDIRSLTFVFYASGTAIIKNADFFRFHIIPSWGGGTFFAILNLNANERDLYVKAVKLEVGATSTLANDAPPDFGEELAKCKRYLRYVSLKRLPVFCDANYLVAMTTLEGIEMRATPTPTLVAAGYIFNPANSATSIPTAVSILAFEYNTATIQLSIPASFNGFCIAVDSAICLSAEL